MLSQPFGLPEIYARNKVLGDDFADARREGMMGDGPRDGERDQFGAEFLPQFLVAGIDVPKEQCRIVDGALQELLGISIDRKSQTFDNGLASMLRTMEDFAWTRSDHDMADEAAGFADFVIGKQSEEYEIPGLHRGDINAMDRTAVFDKDSGHIADPKRRKRSIGTAL